MRFKRNYILTPQDSQAHINVVGIFIFSTREERDVHSRFPRSFQSSMLQVEITYVERRKRSDTIIYIHIKDTFEAHGLDKLGFFGTA